MVNFPPRLILILGDQLSPAIVALREADKSRDIVVMAEVWDEASYVPHHPKKNCLDLCSNAQIRARIAE